MKYRGVNAIDKAGEANRLNGGLGESWHEVYARCVLLANELGEDPLCVLAREMERAARADDRGNYMRFLAGALDKLLYDDRSGVQSWAQDPGPTREELLEERADDEVVPYLQVEGGEYHPRKSVRQDEPPYDYRGQLIHDFGRGSQFPVRVQLSGLIPIDTTLDILRHMVTVIEENKHLLEEKDMWIDNSLWWSSLNVEWPGWYEKNPKDQTKED